MPDRHDPSRAQSPASRADAIEFLLEFGRDLHQSGTPAHRLEETLGAIATQLGLEAEFLSTPTSLLVATGPLLEQRTHLLRVQPGEVNLERLELVDDVAGRVARGETTPEAGVHELRFVEDLPRRYPRWLEPACFGIVASTGAVFFRGSWTDAAFAGLIGVLVGVIVTCFGANRRLARVLEACAGITAGAGSVLAARLVPELSVSIVTLSALLVLLPGLTLMLAVNELATRNLVSGTARMAHASTILVSLALGVAIGWQFMEPLGVGFTDPTHPIDHWWQWPAIAAAAVCLTVLFRATPRSAISIAIVGGIGVLTAQSLGGLTTPGLAAGAGALVIGLLSNAWSRLTDRPAAITSLPGVILLVPGALSLKGIIALVSRETVAGIDTVFSALLIAVALVMGFLFSNVLLPAKKTL